MKSGNTELLKLVEEAARCGDLEKVRRLVAVADALEEHAGTRRPPPPPAAGAAATASLRGARRPQLLAGMLFGYFGYNALATAHAYRTASAEAKAALIESSGEGSEVTLRLRSLSVSAEVLRGTGEGEMKDGKSAVVPPTRHVFVLPHVYLSDALFGRSVWVLTCRKRIGAQGGTQTEWTSKSGAGTMVDISTTEPKSAE